MSDWAYYLVCGAYLAVLPGLGVAMYLSDRRAGRPPFDKRD